MYHDVREIDYKDIDDIITSNLGTDVSKLISNMTMEKFASRA
jgi:type II restriction enzyme